MKCTRPLRCQCHSDWMEWLRRRGGGVETVQGGYGAGEGVEEADARDDTDDESWHPP